VADLASHSLAGWILGVRLLDRARLGWLVTGTLLPDLASRAPRVVIDYAAEAGLIQPSSETARLVLGLDFPHTPVGLLLVALALVALLPERLATPPGRATIFKLLVLGGAVHLAMDALQRHLVPGYRWLYPFSMESWELGWVGTETSLLAAPILLLIAVLLTRRGGRPEGRPPRS